MAAVAAFPENATKSAGGRLRLVQDERPLVVLPKLATEIGLEEAIFAQQVYYWITGPKAHEREGRRWVYNTIDQWRQQFPFWSRSHLHRVIQSCVAQKVVLIAEFNERPADRTKWYTVNPDHPAISLEPAQIPEAGYENPKSGIRDMDIPEAGHGYPTSGTALPETTQETTQNTPPPHSPRREREERFEKFWAAYPRKVGKQPAWKAWLKLDPDAELTDRILNAVTVQQRSQQWTKDNGQFIPHPTTWLNGHRWEDELRPAETRRTNNVHTRGHVG